MEFDKEFNNDDNIRRALIESKIQQIRNLLNQLNQEYNLHYVLGYAGQGISPNQFLVQDFCFNNFVNLVFLDNFIMDLIELRRNVAYWMHLIGSGLMVVACIDDKNQNPALPDKLEIGRFYLVEQMIQSDTTGKFIYCLHNMRTAPFLGYKSDRFMRVYSFFMFN